MDANKKRQIAVALTQLSAEYDRRGDVVMRDQTMRQVAALVGRRHGKSKRVVLPTYVLNANLEAR